jgi:hypothetical protein
VAIEGVKTSLSEIIGLGCDFEYGLFVAAGLVSSIITTTTGCEKHSQDNDEREKCRDCPDLRSGAGRESVESHTAPPNIK